MPARRRGAGTRFGDWCGQNRGLYAFYGGGTNTCEECEFELLLQLIRGETKLVDACREHDLKQSEVEGWMETFLQSGERGLKTRSEDEHSVHERELRDDRRLYRAFRSTELT